MKVLLPSAKSVSDKMLQIGEIPAIVYPVGNCTMLDLIKEHYFENDWAESLEIVAFEGYEKIDSIIGEDSRIHVTVLDELRDIGYSVLRGLEGMSFNAEEEIVINFADIIIKEKWLGKREDKCFYSKEEISSKWAFFEEKDGVITKLHHNTKRIEDIKTNSMMIGLFSICYPNDFLQILKKEVQKEGKLDSFFSTIIEYSKIHPFHMEYEEDWFDLGHIEKYYDIQLEVKERSFNKILIDRDRGILKKTSSNKEKLIGEIKWYLKLPNRLEYVCPRIFSYSIDYDNPFVEMEYYSYHTLHELYLYGDLEEEYWIRIFRRLRFLLDDFGRYRTDEKDRVRKSLREMYEYKTIERLEELKSDEEFISFREPIVINGVSFKPLEEICRLVPDVVEDSLINSASDFSVIHGDLCFSNVLVDPRYSFIKVIDPRGRFGEYDIYGDKRYDLAKIMHSIDGKYDYIIKDRFSITFDKNIIQYSVHGQPQDEVVWKSFTYVLMESTSIDELKLIEALLFLSMIPLHTESRARQYAMLATGIKLFNEVSDIRCN